MYAIIKSGGKQFQVIEGQKLHLELLSGAKGDQIVITDVLALFDGKKLLIGNPILSRASVALEILDQVKDKKIIVFKKKRRKDYKRKHGHRQNLTSVKILKINIEGESTKKTSSKSSDKNKSASNSDLKKQELTSKESKAKKPKSGKASTKKTLPAPEKDSLSKKSK